MARDIGNSPFHRWCLAKPTISISKNYILLLKYLRYPPDVISTNLEVGFRRILLVLFISQSQLLVFL